MTFRKTRMAVTAMAVLSFFPPIVHAGFIEDVAFGLGTLGFDIRGDHNFLSGGIDLLVTNRFRGNELDFGLGSLTLLGPISMELQTGTRGFPEVEFSFTTAVDRNSLVTPLNYNFDYDIGAQSLSITGSIQLDLDLTINALGFYDLGFSYDFTQNAVQEGLILNREDDAQFSVDPINVSGNIFADILVVVTNPIFNALGTTNPFADLSGIAQLNSMTNAAASTRAFTLTDDDLSPVVFNGLDPDPLDAFPEPVFSGSDPSSALRSIERSPAGVVPEPTVLVLMLLGLPAIIRRPRRRARKLETGN